MATLLCVWELGGNLGHLSTLRLPIQLALQAGQKVVVAARQLNRTHEILGDLPVTYLQAPLRQAAVADGQEPFQSFTHVIGRQCFNSSAELATNLLTWRSIFDQVKPTAVLFEHSPTALIAAHGYAFKKVVLGNGFTVPPPSSGTGTPFGVFPTTAITPENVRILLRDDARLLAMINATLTKLGMGSIPNLSHIFGQADETWLLTWPELDQFGFRSNQKYLGIEQPIQRQLPQWPTASGPKVFGYLNAFPSLRELLRDLHASETCALLFVKNLPAELKRLYTSERMHFIDHLVDLNEVARQADWVIGMGNHSTAGAFALAGIPQLLIPTHQEQLFLALRLVSSGGAAMAYQDQAGYASAIGAMLTNPSIRVQAELLQKRMQSGVAENIEGFIRNSLKRIQA